MTLAAGTRLGPYIVEGLLGTGGMGEVYRAEDTRLKRDVALKILPGSAAADPERLARFEREAQVLASLDHPYIGAIYGIEEGQVGPSEAGHQVTALVLQLVEGETLADRIARGPIPIDEALPIARQIAEAVEAAHEQGVIHRDLKPANVKISPDGQVKVLDFGLAKLTEPGTVADPSRSSGLAATMSPTITTPALMTGVGLILGTAAYMSPEQAKGRAADKRSDIWAFGCLLYEMLTGRRVFEGDDVAETLAAVIRGEPDWSRLPKDLPSSIASMLKRCIVKDRRERISDAAAILFVLRESASGNAAIGVPGSTLPAGSRWRRAAAYLAVAAAVAALTSAAWWFFRPAVEPRLVTRFTMTLPDRQPFLSQYQVVAISPDGARIAYVANFRLHVRAMGELEGKPVPGTENLGARYPTFSPDGSAIVFHSGTDQTLKKVAVGGGSVATLCRTEEEPAGISWGPAGIVFGQGEKGIMRVSPDGGSPELIASVSRGESAYGPQMLPGDSALLFTIATGGDVDRWDKARVVVHSLASSQRKTLFEGGSDARYLPSGYIVYAVGGVVFARRFERRRLEVSGEPVVVVDGVRRTGATRALSGAGVGLATTQFAVASSGTLVYVPGPSSSASLLFGNLVLSSRDGKVEPLKLPPGPYQLPRVSPDGKQVTFGTDDGKSARVWVYDLAGAESVRPLTFEGNSRFPIWSADGQWIVFQSDHEGDLAIFRRRADGTSVTGERLTKPNAGEAHAPEAWSPQGDTLLYNVTKGETASLWMLSLRERKSAAFPGLQQLADWPTAAFSADGRWVAYARRIPGERSFTVFVEPFPPTGVKHQMVTNSGPRSGTSPVWSPNSKELFYVSAAAAAVTFSSVTVITKPRVVFGNTIQLQRGFRVAGGGLGRARTFDVMPDGQHFIGFLEADEIENGRPGTQQLQVVLNWTEELKRLMP